MGSNQGTRRSRIPSYRTKRGTNFQHRKWQQRSADGIKRQPTAELCAELNEQRADVTADCHPAASSTTDSHSKRTTAPATAATTSSNSTTSTTNGINDGDQQH